MKVNKAEFTISAVSPAQYPAGQVDSKKESC